MVLLQGGYDYDNMTKAEIWNESNGLIDIRSSISNTSTVQDVWHKMYIIDYWMSSIMYGTISSNKGESVKRECEWNVGTNSS